jgi:hypothetical protein
MLGALLALGVLPTLGCFGKWREPCWLCESYRLFCFNNVGSLASSGSLADSVVSANVGNLAGSGSLTDSGALANGGSLAGSGSLADSFA